MITIPQLSTPRLRLRPFAREDAGRISELAGAREIADTTISIPHPYPPKLAQAWIDKHPALAARDEAWHWAIERRHEAGLIGGIGLREIDREHIQAEVGFWIGVPWWGHGFALEAVRAVADFAFVQLDLNRLYAHHMVRNPASGRVLAKAGFQREGLLRERVRKWGVFEDVVLLSLLRREWEPPSP